jgi:hypothetical protein
VISDGERSVFNRKEVDGEIFKQDLRSAISWFYFTTGQRLDDPVTVRLVKENACPPLIDRETWQKAQEKLKATKESGKRTHAGKSSPLSGIVFCGHCGKAMVKNTRNGVTRFTCSTASKNSATATCKQWTVQESDILPIMVEKLTQACGLRNS